ncbi:major facilitator superfamily domain-containing protein [Dactylonectria estremocensis]|uniref:Major facilitator superfamily domain-containing protein n=1 Tax=Dactylonectria estremocensis TaxID=1079267 RepID=A0A9P9EQZ4_9HYPO|nr:major facilitator superfamily domain-containing protein [Dactylonectria estremocensis]
MSDPGSEKAQVIHDLNGSSADMFEGADKNDLDLHNSHAFKSDDSDGSVVWTPKAVIAALSLGALYSGSQVNLYFVGGSLSYIEADLGATANGVWLPVSNTLAITAVAPFVGYLQDLLGRREITLMGLVIIMVGLALIGSAHSFGQAIAGMSLSGAGAGICELTALAGISDIVPVRQRGISLALVTAFLLPFTPYVMYSQLLSIHATWRWTMWLTLIWNAFVLIGLAFTYFPKDHPRVEGVSNRDILRQIDYVGAVLSITGITLLLVALQGGGYTHPWKSAYILVQLILGIVLIALWIIWEWKFAKNPMVPRELFAGQKIVGMAFFIAFVAGLNFYSLINFFPLTFSAVYTPDPVQIGLKGLGYGISITAGAVFFNSLLSVKAIPASATLTIAAILMTAFGGSLSATTPDNPKFTVAMGTIAGFGVGGLLVPAATVAMIVVPDSLLATTAALSLSIRTLGGSIGYTIYYNVFVNKLTGILPTTVAEYAIAAGLAPEDAEVFVGTLLTAPADISTVPGYTPAILQAAVVGVRWAYAGALKYVWYASIPFGIVTIVAATFLPSIKKYQTNRVAVSL